MSGGTPLIIRIIPLRPARSGQAAAYMRIGIASRLFSGYLFDNLRDNLLFIVAVFMLSILVGTVLMAVLTRSLRSVASYAMAIENDDLASEIEITGHDEAATIAEAFNQVIHRLRQSYVSTLGALASLLETKDRLTETHSLRGVRYAMELGRGAGLSKQEMTELEYGALLHDIGKIGIADIILKKTGPLTEEEWQVMRQHPTIGYNVLKSLEFLQNSLPVVLHHQERFDGRGYPNGLKGEQIPLLARIFAIADSFDAMTSDRPYRHAMREEVALQEIRRNAGAQFDPRLVEIFIKLWEEGRLQQAAVSGRLG
jgi:HD-GYP domain-containing protein (c-di-GMP phosphodiesterase class II)